MAELPPSPHLPDALRAIVARLPPPSSCAPESFVAVPIWALRRLLDGVAECERVQAERDEARALASR